MTIHHPERWQAFLGKANEGETELATDDGPLTYRELERAEAGHPGHPGADRRAPAARDGVGGASGTGVVQGAGAYAGTSIRPDPRRGGVAGRDGGRRSIRRFQHLWGSYDHASGLGRTWILDSDHDDYIGEVPAVAPPSSSGDMMPDSVLRPGLPRAPCATRRPAARRHVAVAVGRTCTTP